jgi:two-component system NarL family sensor kinase
VAPLLNALPKHRRLPPPLPVRPPLATTPEASATGAPRRALVQFVLVGVATLLLLVLSGTVISRAASRDEAVTEARLVTEIVARSIVEPNLRDGLLTGESGAFAALDAVVRPLTTGGPLIRVKLWTGDGRIVYSDDQRLLGHRYPLGPDERRALVEGGAEAEISDLSRAENVLERELGTLLEVYLPVRTPAGEVLLFETYAPLSSVSERARDVWMQFLPITVGGLVLLQAVQIPLAVRLARQTARARREREEMLHRALAASDAERRRIAGDLHDGVVQDLAATSMALGGSAAAAAQQGRASESHGLCHAAESIRGAIRSLRSLVVDIYPPNLHRAGLAAVLPDLAAALTARGVAVTVDVDDDATGGEHAERVVFRVAQEALRNVAAHAGATSVQVRLDRVGDVLVLTVVDDGIGFDPDRPAPSDRPHLGLRLIHDVAADVGARIDIVSASDAGTRVRLEVPVR